MLSSAISVVGKEILVGEGHNAKAILVYVP